MLEQEVEQTAADSRIIEEDYSLLGLAGGKKGLDKMFSKENIARAQSVIDTAKTSFFDNSASELKQMRESIYDSISGKDAMGVSQLKGVFDYARSLRQRADALNFPFISTICAHIEEVCIAPINTSINYTHLIRDMMDVLLLALQNKIVSETSKTGQDVIAILNAVSARIANVKNG